MAKRKRLSPNQLAVVKGRYATLKTFRDYESRKPEFSVAAIGQIDTDIDNLLEEEAQAKANLEDIRSRLADKGYEYTQATEGAGVQVKSQYGDDSPEYAAYGYKRSSERAAPRRKDKTGSGNKPNG